MSRRLLKFCYERHARLLPKCPPNCPCKYDGRSYNLYYRDFSFQLKYDPTNNLILQETINLQEDTRIIIYVYEHNYQRCGKSCTSSVIVVPIKHVDYKVCIREEIKGIPYKFTGKKIMNFNTYTTLTTTRVSANMSLRNTWDLSEEYSDYELQIRILVTEPPGNGWNSRFIFTDNIVT